jgi:hypothetical protein
LRVKSGELEEAYQAVFLAALGRRAAPAEIGAWLNNGGTATDPADLAAALRTTAEFENRIALRAGRLARNAGGRKVFFLHIPKCGGISLQNRLREALGGLPPIEYSFHPYDHTLFPGADCWPFLTGHVSVECIPPTHTAITVFREPRARILSLHRFVSSYYVERFLAANNREEETSRRWRSTPLRELLLSDPPEAGDWGTFRFAWRFAAGVANEEQFMAMRRDERETAMRRGLDKIGRAAWTHDEPGLTDLVDFATGKRTVSVRLNESPPDAPMVRSVIDAETMVLLDRITADERQLAGMAAERGLIAHLPKDTADAIFLSTARRLGYEAVR